MSNQISWWPGGKIQTKHVADGAIGNTQIGADAVTGAKIADDAVDTEHLAADAVDSAALDPTILKRTTGTIAAASVRTLNATPVSVIAAPGANKFTQVVSCRWFLDFATTGYDAAASGDSLVLKYTNGSGAEVVDSVAGDAIGAATADYHVVVDAVPEVIPVANAAIVAHVNTGEWYSAAGDSPLKYEIYYRTVPVDPTA